MGRATSAGLTLALAAISLVASSCTAGDDPTPTLSYLRDHVFAKRCTAACHSGGENAAGGLDMSADLHRRLILVPASAAECAGTGVRVVPGDPGKSLLYTKVSDKIEGATPSCGDTMPLGPDLPALSSDEADLLRRWILAGAPDD